MPQAGLTGSKQVQQSAQYAALSDYLAKKKKLEDALDAFCEPVEQEYKSTAKTEEVEEHLTISWRAIIAQVAQASFKDDSQQKLVDLVVALRSRPTLQKDSQTCQIQGMTVWQDLPTFGWALRDAWNLAAGQDSDEESQAQWINLNAYTAALLGATYPQCGDDLGLSLFCIWTVRQALEESPGVSDVAVAAAAAWFTFAGPTIWSLCSQQKSFEGNLAKPGSAFEQNGWKGFSQDRWQVWKDRLAGLEQQISDNTAKQLVQQARKAMDEV